jgi:pyridoxal phosphate enzyme (YggS family)
MSVNATEFDRIRQELELGKVTLVAVSKLKSTAEIRQLYDMGQRDFGENYVQELLQKKSELPPDIRWHFIGHLQTNKVKLISPFIHLIHSVDSLKLLQEIEKQGAQQNRVLQALLQIHIAKEETKFGLDEKELEKIIQDPALSAMKHVQVSGLMGMATFENDPEKVRGEFRFLKTLFEKFAPEYRTGCQMKILSMGMSSDYEIAVQEGSTMVRIGSLIFGARTGRWNPSS